jgi:AraC-like DNA-binding protein
MSLLTNPPQANDAANLAGMLADQHLGNAPSRPLVAANDPVVARSEDHYLTFLGATPLNASDGRVGQIEALLRRSDITTVAQLAAAMQMQQVTLKRLCHRAYGLPPKTLLIRHRLARMLSALDHRPYRELNHFLDLGYTDQSHFIRDFKMFFGMPPTRYLAQRG